MMMNYKKVAGAGIAAVTLSLMSTSAMAAFTGTAVNFATQAIVAPGSVTIPAGSIVYTTEANSTSTGSFNITFTLPAGATFAIAPTITVGGNTGTATLQGTAVGASTATFVVTLTALAGAPAATTLTFSSFAITGATALATAKTGVQFPITEQIIASTVTGNPAQTTAVTGALATSVNAATLASTAQQGAVGALAVDITGSSGAKFKNNAVAAATVGDDGALNFAVATAVKADGVTQYAFTATTLTETLTGNTGGLTGAYLTATGAPPTACAATLATNTGGTAGTITAGGNTIVFPGVAVAGGAREVCLYGAGTLLAANPNGFSATAAIDTSVSTPVFTQAYNYNGTISNYAYATNATQYYQQYVRITNPLTTPIVVTAQVTTDAGVSTLATVETALAAGASDLVPVSTIATNAGSTSANGRFSISLFGPSGTYFENLLVNPGGVVTELNRNFTTQ